MVVLGLTGTVAMGKSTTGRLCAGLGVPVFDSDAVARRATEPGGAAAAAVRAAFPEAADGEDLDRATLARRVFSDRAALNRLEAIVHPLVAAARDAWLRRYARARTAVVVLDVPLLFETGGDVGCDAVLVVSAPAFLQRQRVLQRPAMDERRLRGILARQMPAAEQRRRADAVIPTGQGRRATLRILRRVLRRYRPGTGARFRSFRPGSAGTDGACRRWRN